MYIAFKWLVGMTLVMWMLMCVLDICIKNRSTTKRNSVPPFEWTYTNKTFQQVSEIPAQKIFYNEKFDQYNAAVLHYTMFIAGAIAVSVFNKKSEIISYTKNTLAKIDMIAIIIVLNKSLNKIAIILSVAITTVTLSWSNVNAVLSKILHMLCGLKRGVDKNKHLNMHLLQNLKEYDVDREKLGQLLIAAVRENKNLRMQYQLETMAKNRLLRHVEDTQKKIKESRSRYVSFQHLYIVTHQENIFLKARIRKLTQEKEDSEKDLMTIVNKVYQSKNNDLISYCSHLRVKPKENLLNSDVNAEVRMFLEKSQTPTNWIIPNNLHIDNKNYKCSHTQIIKCSEQDAILAPLVSDAPRLKGLPGECIWTVKDKDGFIEKLYECDFESDLDNGDIIRRIRKYSVYFDKDCLLDLTRSKSFVSEMNDGTNSIYPTSERFLTGSEAFQNFWHKNKDVSSSTSPTYSLLCV